MQWCACVWLVRVLLKSLETTKTTDGWRQRDDNMHLFTDWAHTHIHSLLASDKTSTAFLLSSMAVRTLATVSAAQIVPRSAKEITSSHLSQF